MNEDRLDAAIDKIKALEALCIEMSIIIGKSQDVSMGDAKRLDSALSDLEYAGYELFNNGVNL